jgi:hypothetical protein
MRIWETILGELTLIVKYYMSYIHKRIYLI